MSSKKTYEKSPTEERSPQKVKKKQKKQKQTNWLLLGFGLGTIAAVAATAGALLAVTLSGVPLKQAKLTEEQAAVFSQEEAVSYSSLRIPELTRPVNILVLGTKVLTSEVDDPRQKDLGYQALVNSFDGLTDTMLLLRFDPTPKKFTVLSIPRDTQVQINGHGTVKINAANSYGGPALSAQTVSELLDGVTIDRFVRVNVQGVEKLIDALGGVTVYIPKDMKYQDDSQHLYINFKQGEHHLTGQQAQAFLRFRYDQYGDIGRVQRQQMLMRSIIEQSLRPQTILRIPDILSIVQSHIDTNVTVDEIVALAGFAGQLKKSDMQMLLLPGNFNGDGKEGISYWLPRRNAIREMAAKYFGEDEGGSEIRDIDPSRLRIAIQDSTGEENAAQTMVRYLREAGYTNVYINGAWSQPLQKTRILAQGGDDGGAAMLRATLGIGEVLVESTGVLNSDVTIQLGQDWLEKEKQI
jgi:LCP family protein required for cell wall assembly